MDSVATATAVAHPLRSYVVFLPMVRFLRRLGSFAPVSYPRNLVGWTLARTDMTPFPMSDRAGESGRTGFSSSPLGVGKDEPPGRI